MSDRPTGLTQDAGWEIGVSRTFPAEPAEAWERLTSREGLALWLGEGVAAPPEPGTTYATSDGARGEVRSVRPGEKVRLTWQPPGRASDATVQVALREAAGGCTVSFHAERLDSAEEREAMRDHWRAVLDRLGELLHR